MKKDCLLSNLNIKKNPQTPKNTNLTNQTKTPKPKNSPTNNNKKTPLKNPLKKTWLRPGKEKKHLPMAQGKVNYLKEDEEFRESYFSFPVILLRWDAHPVC